MTRRILWVAVVAGLAAGAAYWGIFYYESSYDGPPIPSHVADANNAFAIDFYRQIRADPEQDGKNLFFSPVSMYTAFSVLYEGARANTAAQMEDVFNLESNDAARHEAMTQMMASISRDDPLATLDIANALWIADWSDPYDSYVDVARTTYLAGIDTVDFETQESVDRINQWASDNTNGKIEKVITKDDVDDLTVMVINNAIYFKGTWATQFPVEDTKESDFYKSADDPVRAEFMNVQNMFNYTASDGIQVLKMPYKGDRLSMLVILPDDMDRLDGILSAAQTRQWNNDLRETEVVVSVPKFETRTNYILNKHLGSLGMPDAFDKEKADLSGIADLSQLPENLYVYKASQDAYVMVNEEGTEAAAVTTVILITDSVPPPPPRFIADRPFLFMIQDDESGTILFMGMILDPTA